MIGQLLFCQLLAPTELSAETADQSLDRLVRAYPEALSGHDDRDIFWRDGTIMHADDGIGAKSFDELLRNASILDQLRLPYLTGASRPPQLNDDPGRFRNEAFFRKMYGDCHNSDFQKNLATIAWLPRSWGKEIRVTRI